MAEPFPLLAHAGFAQQLATTGWTPELLSYPTPHLAPCLLGQTLRVRLPNGRSHPFTLTEVEAYTQTDPACHAYGRHPAKGYRGRALTLFAAPGTVYVYLIYGMYFCLNLVTEAEGRAGALLIRGVRPVAPWQGGRTDGPGRLCRSLGINMAHNGRSLFAPDASITLEAMPLLSPQQVKATPRIGISKAQDRLWRFCTTQAIEPSSKIET